MLLRPATTRILATSTRSLSKSPTPDDKTITAAFAALGALPPPPPAAATAAAAPAPSPAASIPPPEDPLLHYLASSLLTHGHRARAARTTARTLLHLHTLTRAPPLPALRAAVLAAAPAVRTLLHRQGAKSVAKPAALGEKQRTRCAVQWILAASEKREGRSVEERLAREVVAVLQGTSEALRKKEEAHRFAMVNRGNARSRV